MPTIAELRDKRNKAWEAAKAFLTEHTNDKGLLSAEDDATYSKMEAEITDYGKAIDRLERQAALDAQLASATREPIVNTPGKGKTEAGNVRASDDYREAMTSALRSKFMLVSDVLQEGIDTDGGYLVPEEYDRQIVTTLSKENIMRQLGTVITTSSTHKIPIGVTSPAASWIEEGGSIQFSDATFSQKYLEAHKLAVAIKVTEELLYDSAYDIQSYINTEFGGAIANAEEDAFLNGDGNGKPLGLFAASGGGTVAATVAKLTSDDILNLEYALKRPYRRGSTFIINDDLMSVIRKFKDANGQYLWQPSLRDGEPDRLNGYAVKTSAYAPKDAIAFGAMKYYRIGDRGSRSFRLLTELFAGEGMAGYVAKERVDGKLVLPEAVQIIKISA